METLRPPGEYSSRQLMHAVAFAAALAYKANRGKLILTEKPEGGSDEGW